MAIRRGVMNPFLKMNNINGRETTRVEFDDTFGKGTIIPEEENIVKEDESTKYLSVTDKLEFQLVIEQGKSSGFELEAIQSKINALRALIQNYEMRLPQLKNEMQELKDLFEEKKNEFAETQSNKTKLFTQLSKKYDLSSTWDFDRTTGKITC